MRQTILSIFFLFIVFLCYSVKPYESVELTFNGTIYSKPYWNVDLDVTFKCADGESIKVPGFWDGGNIWKVRFSPISLGKWNYITQSNDPLLNNISGFVECSGESEKGWIVTDTVNTHGFIWSGDGESYPVFGDCWWGHMSSGIDNDKFPHEKFEQVVDIWSAAGYNFAYCMLSSWIPSEQLVNWHNEGGRPWEVLDNKFDLTRPNPSYFREVDKRIEYANKKGMCICLDLTESKSLITDINIYKKFGRYALARWAASNISIWIIGEYDDREGKPFTVADWDNIGTYLQTCNPYRHPISLHCLYSTGKDFGNKKWHDYIVQQHDHTNSTMVRDFSYAKPVLSAEWYMGWDTWVNTPEQELNFAWENMVGGGWVCSGHRNMVYANYFGWNTLEPYSETYLGYVEVMKDFFTNHFIRFNEREPSNELVDTGFACRVGNDEFLIYQDSAKNFTLDLTGIDATFNVYTFNCRNGQMIELGIVRGGDFIDFNIMPDADEFLVYLSKDTLTDICLNSKSNEINVFPNPVNDHLFFYASKEIEISIKIISIEGKILFVKDNFKLPNQIEFSWLSKGIYFIRITGEGHCSTKTILKK